MGGSGSGQGVMGQLATLVYGPWPTSALSRPGKPACFRRWQVCLFVCQRERERERERERDRETVCLSVCLSVSLSIYIYIYILYCMQNLGNVDFIHTGL